jgi:hypothetical protein
MLNLGDQMKSWILAGLALTFGWLHTATYVSARTGELSLVCTGNSYKRGDPFPTAETFSLRIGGTKPVVIGGPGSAQPLKARIIANNDIQLKFTTGKFTGEYFHLTGDLFLIHNDGRLTKLMCRPS